MPAVQSPDVIAAHRRPAPPPARPASPLRIRAPQIPALPVAGTVAGPGWATASGRAGQTSACLRGPQLLDAASLSYEAVRALLPQCARQDARPPDWHSRSLPSALFATKACAGERAVRYR